VSEDGTEKVSQDELNPPPAVNSQLIFGNKLQS